MGAADVVPGVSGGTIAFITGIYEELLNSISSINLHALKTIRTKGIKAAWKTINGNFLVVLVLGIGISVLSLAKLLTYLLDEHPIPLWAFFFGLIVASAPFVGKAVKKWNVGTVIALVAGTGIAYYLTILPKTSSPDEYWFLFLSGMIAICAMILPGISGSFILLLLGAYEYILAAVNEKNLMVLGIVAIGAVVGLLSFSRLLSWLFKKYHDLTIAVLTGFLIGSLNKIWPWKETVEFRKDSHGDLVPFIQENIAPNEQVGMAILFGLLGFLLVVGLELVSRKRPK